MQSSLLPITAIVAVLIFLAREIVEALRRRRADDRKRTSLRALLARECELNNWTIKQLRSAANEIEGPREDGSDPNKDLTVHFSPRGKTLLRREHEGGGYGQSWLPEIDRSIAEKFMLDVAFLDKKLLDKLISAYDELANLTHVRDSMIDHLMSNDPLDRLHLTDFPTYALSELDAGFEALEELYKECTGNALTEHRLR